MKYTFSFSILLFAMFLLITFFIITTTASNCSMSLLYGDSFSAQIAYAHMPTNNVSRIQNWTDIHNKINIQFTYEPERPIIDTFTELKFSAENTTTGGHITDKSALARVVVTNGQRLFKFENISVGNDGHFSVKYLFPDDGTHQVITRLDTKDSSTAAPFNVFVPHQRPPSMLNPFPSSPSSTAESDNNQQIGLSAIVVAGIITSAAVITVFIIKRKQKYPPNNQLS